MKKSKENILLLKKVTKKPVGHHGGAWKVAYADFVTAMMAFFLLMWLLNAVESEKLQQLSDYFAPTKGVRDNMGVGFRGGKRGEEPGIGSDDITNKGIVLRAPPTGPIHKVTERLEERTDEIESHRISISEPLQNIDSENEDHDQIQSVREELENQLDRLVQSNRIQEGFINIAQVPDGLLVEFGNPQKLEGVFVDNSVELIPGYVNLFEIFYELIRDVPNSISIIGYVNFSFQNQDNYSELSLERANMIRKVLQEFGLKEKRVFSVVGRLDNFSGHEISPFSQYHNRASILIRKLKKTPEFRKIDLKGN